MAIGPEPGKEEQPHSNSSATELNANRTRPRNSLTPQNYNSRILCSGEACGPEAAWTGVAVLQHEIRAYGLKTTKNIQTHYG